jgi:formylglycine-generating enzyme required for sulfatase activity
LPSEAEWEYACRAGTTSAFSFGDTIAPEQVNYDGRHPYGNDAKGLYRHKTVVCGSLPPNSWGLHEMHGNVCEWVLDQYVPDFYKQFASKTAVAPLAPATAMFPRVVRGGSWIHDPKDLRSAARFGSHKDWKMQDPQIPQSIWYLTDADFVGFRVVRPLRKPTPEEAKKYEPDQIQVEEYLDYLKAQAGKI